MDEGLRKAVMEWFDRGDRDLETAKLLYDENGYTDMIAYHIQQAAEKYLKGFLTLLRQRPPKIHDLDALLSLISKTEPDLYDDFIDLCEKATRYYIEERYPPGPPADYSRKEIKADLERVWEPVQAIRTKAGMS